MDTSADFVPTAAFEGVIDEREEAAAAGAEEEAEGANTVDDDDAGATAVGGVGTISLLSFESFVVFVSSRSSGLLVSAPALRLYFFRRSVVVVGSGRDNMFRRGR